MRDVIESYLDEKPVDGEEAPCPPTGGAGDE